MEKLRIGTEEKEYPYRSIMPVSTTVLQIIFDVAVPTEWGDITLITTGGVEADTLTGYNTVYRRIDYTVWLSNDGSVYQEPEPMPEPEPYEPPLSELQAAKRREVAAACERCIYAGINVTLSDGTTEHYALTIEDQLNLFGKQSQLAAGASQLEYHADGKPCRYYNAADMQAVINAALQHVSYHTTYCNAINMWIIGCQTAEELNAIFYGADVPEQYQSDVLKVYLAQIAAMMGGADGAV